MGRDKDPEFLPPDLDALLRDPVPPGADTLRDTGAASAVGQVLTRHHDALMARSGVVMIGETRDMSGGPALLVGVRAARDLSRLPTQIDGVPVVTQVIGDVTPQ
jgi:hypothetical protein